MRKSSHATPIQRDRLWHRANYVHSIRFKTGEAGHQWDEAWEVVWRGVHLPLLWRSEFEAAKHLVQLLGHVGSHGKRSVEDATRDFLVALEAARARDKVGVA